MENRKYPLTYQIYDSVYSDELPNNQLFLLEFDCIPSTYDYGKKIFDHSVTDILNANGFEKYVSMKHSGFLRINLRNTDSSKETERLLMINRELQMIVLLQSIYEKNKKRYNLSFAYNINRGKFENQIKFLNLSELERKREKSNIGLIKTQNGFLDVEDFDLNVPKIDLKLNYGDEFLKVHKLIESRLKKEDDTGIILLHGEPGTGKTSYLKYLTSLTTKQILFVPPSMAESLSEPSIIPFLMDYSNSILIIEDAEKVITDRKTTGSSIGVSNILNITDGILGECLKIQIIATFNMEKEKIDSALLRKGRLIAEHKFEKLNVEESNRLISKLGVDYVTDKPMNLSDIYNINEEFHTTIKQKTQIGF